MIKRVFITFIALIVISCLACANSLKEDLPSCEASGGIIVYIGNPDLEKVKKLHAEGQFLVQVLHRNKKHVIEFRESISSAGIYGPVSARVLSGDRLPYVNNLINLVVVNDMMGLSEDELLRVMRPLGQAHIRVGDKWRTLTKPWPNDIDEWTHFLRDPSNNAVALDDKVGPPRRMQWTGAPMWARSHEHQASISTVVSARGRIFYIVDEGPTASVTLPPEWVLVARDAFNGVILWKRPIQNWESHLRPFRSGPTHLPRRLVAVDDKVFVTLGYNQPISLLDAATGKTIRSYPGTETAQEILYENNTLFLVMGDFRKDELDDYARKAGISGPVRDKSLLVLNAESGSTIWQKSGEDTTNIMPATLALENGLLFFENTDNILCLDAGTGREKWRAARPVNTKRRASVTPTLVVHDGIVLSADQHIPEQLSADRKVDWEVSMRGDGDKGMLFAYNAQTGQKLWEVPCTESYSASPDVFVLNDEVWTGFIVKAKDDGFTNVYDLKSGRTIRTFEVDQHFKEIGMPHARCYRNKATSNYILAGRSGIEYVDTATGKAELHNWVRGACQYGIMPANGLIYAPSHSCACYLNAKLNGFNALAAEQNNPVSNAPRWERGPAFGFKAGSKVVGDWGHYRGNSARTGFVDTNMSTELKIDWSTKLNGNLTALTTAAGKVFVASVDAHTVHALDADDGDPLWNFIAGGRIDSPPTYDKGRLLFGSADGYVYCLRASDGELIWRFRAAPDERWVVSYGQLESAWPVSGSMLVMDDVAYCAAGRSSFLDGGIQLCRIDVATGKLLTETIVEHYDDETGRQPPAEGFSMEGALPDVLLFDGEAVCMRHLRFHKDTLEPLPEKPHLFTPTGFLDDSWWHRSYWVYAPAFDPGWGGWWKVGNYAPSGRILSISDDTVYGFGRSFFPGRNAGQWNEGEAYQLFSLPKFPKLPPDSKRPSPYSLKPEYRWQKEALVNVRAMVVAGNKAFFAGPLGDINHDLDAFNARKGTKLITLAVNDGRQLSELTLPASPVFDGMAVTDGKLFISLNNGQVMALSGGRSD